MKFTRKQSKKRKFSIFHFILLEINGKFLRVKNLNLFLVILRKTTCKFEINRRR